MPIGPWIIPAISAVGQGVQSYLESRKRKQGYELSPEELEYLNYLRGEREQGLPASMSAPFYAQARGIEQHFAGQPGSSAKSFAVKEREAWTPMAEQARLRRGDIEREIAGIVGGRGTQWQTGQPFDVGAPASDLGEALWMYLNRKKRGESVFWPGGTPSSFDLRR